jgi:hypothetical protein
MKSSSSTCQKGDAFVSYGRVSFTASRRSPSRLKLCDRLSLGRLWEQCPDKSLATPFVSQPPLQAAAPVIVSSSGKLGGCSSNRRGSEGQAVRTAQSVDAGNSHARLVYNRPPWLKLSTSVPPPSDANRKNCPPRSRHRLRNDPEAGSQPPTAQQDFPDSVPNNNHPSAWPPPRSPPPLPTRSAGTLPSTARSESPFTQPARRRGLAQPTPLPKRRPPLQTPPPSQRMPRRAAETQAHGVTALVSGRLDPWGGVCWPCRPFAGARPAQGGHSEQAP